MLDSKLVKRAIEQISKRAANYEYFFDQLGSPEWIEPLAAEGFFRNPPPPSGHGDSVIFPLWPESRYLVRMASAAPDTVLKVAAGISHTENPRVYEDLADMALMMPADSAIRLVGKVEDGFISVGSLHLGVQLGRLVTHLVSGNEVASALHLARVLLEVLPDPRAELDTPADDPVLPPTPTSRLNTWGYGEVLKNDIPGLVEAAGVPALSLLCDLLENALRLSEAPGQSRSPYDGSSIWRPDLSIDQEPRLDLKDLLVSAVRDASERLSATTGSEVLSIIENRPYRVFQRIGLHLRRTRPELDPEGTAELVQREGMLDDIELWHEFFHLLNERFGGLPLWAQQAYLALVDRGPKTEKWVAYSTGVLGHAPSEEDVGAYVRAWQYEKLIPIERYLNSAWRERYEEMSREFGEIEHPDYLLDKHCVWHGPTSPKTAEELGDLEVDDLVSFLTSWRPGQDRMGPSPEGLGRMLQSAVSTDPERYAKRANVFQGLDPTYVRALVAGIEQATKDKKVFPWSNVLDLCRWAVLQPREIAGRVEMDGHADPGWGWTRKAVASLLGEGLNRVESEIPYSLRTAIWEVLRPLIEDPEPTPEYEAQFGGTSMDPVTLSINTVRGEAMHAAVRYALWVRRHEDRTAQEEGSRGFQSMPEVQEALDNHLDPDREPSAAIRSVYGRCFPWLTSLDPVWAATNLPRVFPADKALSVLRDAAWAAYVVFCKPYDSVFSLLRAEYAKAIERIGTVRESSGLLANQDEDLAEHLVTLYWRGRIDLDEPLGLLNRFFDVADDTLRAHALAFVGRSLNSTPGELPPEILERLAALWDGRISAAVSGDVTTHTAEMGAFGWWSASGKFADEWSLTQLQSVLRITNQVEVDHLVLARLASLSAVYPLQCVTCLESLLARAPTWLLDTWDENPKRILEGALGSADSSAKETAVRLINRLGARGYLRFRSLLAEHS